MKTHQKGQGAQVNPHNRFLKHERLEEDAYLNYLAAEGEEKAERTSYTEVFPKTIVNRVTSPDVGMDWSLNPYQGCEHGCTYCYARNTHEFWGFSSGIDFERKVLIKKNAPELLAQTLEKKSWIAAPIVLSGNTDCYQPAERKFQITRQLLQTFWRFRHPVGVITKNAMIQRDLDIVKQLHSENLIQVVLSITTLDEDLRRKMEPRTASTHQRLKTVEALAKIGVPVSVMMAPIVPGLNSHEIFQVLRAAKNAGARTANYTAVRLNGQIGEIFTDWLQHTFPDRAEKVLNHISGMHGGSLRDSQFGRRMRGEGQMARQISDTFRLARKKFFGEPQPIALNCVLHNNYKDDQLSLF